MYASVHAHAKRAVSSKTGLVPRHWLPRDGELDQPQVVHRLPQDTDDDKIPMAWR